MHIQEVFLGKILQFFAQAMSQAEVSIPQANDAYCILPLYHKKFKNSLIYVIFRFWASSIILITMHVRNMLNMHVLDSAGVKQLYLSDFKSLRQPSTN